MTYRSLLLFGFCAMTLACSSETKHPPAVSSNVDSGFADRSVPALDTAISDSAEDTGALADGDAADDTTPADTTPAADTEVPDTTTADTAGD